LPEFKETRIFATDFGIRPQILNSIKIPPVGSELFRADRQTDRHDEFNSHFLQFYWSA